MWALQRLGPALDLLQLEPAQRRGDAAPDAPVARGRPVPSTRRPRRRPGRSCPASPAARPGPRAAPPRRRGSPPAPARSARSTSATKSGPSSASRTAAVATAIIVCSPIPRASAAKRSQRVQRPRPPLGVEPPGLGQPRAQGAHDLLVVEVGGRRARPRRRPRSGPSSSRRRPTPTCSVLVGARRRGPSAAPGRGPRRVGTKRCRRGPWSSASVGPVAVRKWGRGGRGVNVRVRRLVQGRAGARPPPPWSRGPTATGSP